MRRHLGPGVGRTDGLIGGHLEPLHLPAQIPDLRQSLIELALLAMQYIAQLLRRAFEVCAADLEVVHAGSVGHGPL